VVLQSVEVGLPAADYRPEVRLPVEPLRLSLPTARHGVVPAGRELPERNSAPARRTVAVWAMGEPDGIIRELQSRRPLCCLVVEEKLPSL
jgi:hypothetical protein